MAAKKVDGNCSRADNDITNQIHKELNKAIQLRFPPIHFGKENIPLMCEKELEEYILVIEEDEDLGENKNNIARKKLSKPKEDLKLKFNYLFPERKQNKNCECQTDEYRQEIIDIMEEQELTSDISSNIIELMKLNFKSKFMIPSVSQ